MRQRGVGGVVGDSGNAGTLMQPHRATRRTFSDSKTSKGYGRYISSAGLVGIFLLFVFALGATGTVVFSDLMHEASTSVRGMKEPVDRKQYEALEQRNRALQRELVDIQKQSAAAGTGKLTGSAESAKLMKTVNLLTKYKIRMHEMIQLISKRQLLDKYGKSPHYVEILLSFDPKSNVAVPDKTEDTEVLLIQLAPIDEMPATVFWFLEQVNSTLYNGCSFHRNAGHVVQGGPAPNFETVKGSKGAAQRFKEAGLDSVPFQE